MAAPRMSFDFALGSAAARGRRHDDGPFRLLLVADLGGARDTPLAQRKPLVVDIDNLDRVLARIAPRLELTLDELPQRIDFSALDDFHPDRLFARVPVFDAWRRLRAELEDPAQFRRAATALGLQAPVAAAAPPAAVADAATDIERLLGRKASAAAVPAAAPTPAADALQRWLQAMIAPHVTPDTASEQRALLAAADQALSATMRRVLHDPAFQTLEASWLAVDRLVRGLDLGESLQLQVLDAGAAELRHDVHAHAGDLSASAVHRQFGAAGGASAESARWSLVVVDHAFGPEADDVRALAALGAVAARAGCPVVANGLPALAGAAGTPQLAEPRRWLAEDDEALATWQALRGSPMAPWIGLVLPRVLLRLPYGAAGDRITAFDFEEMPEPRDHRAYLWGGGAPALAVLAGLAVQQDPEAPAFAATLDLEDLPSHVYSEDGERHQQPCAELLMGEEAGQALLQRGLMPWLSYRGRNAARLLRWQSVAQPAQALQGL